LREGINNTMKDIVHTVCDALYSLCIWIAGLAILAMSAIIPWGIFTRYVLGTGSQWPEPVSILLMVMFTFFGAAAGVRANTHIAVEMLTERLPESVQRLAQKTVSLLMALLAVFMVVWGWKLASQMFQQSVPDLPWMPVGITYLPVPIGGAITFAFVLEALFFGSQSNRRSVNVEKSLDHAPAAEGAHQ
jgi:TRAP-type C4-dicarboxylate transport system permease small subunit